MMTVQLDEHLACHVAEGGRGAHCGGEHDAAARGEVGGFHHGQIHRPEEAVASHLRHQRKVQVEEARLAGVDARAGWHRSGKACGS